MARPLGAPGSPPPPRNSSVGEDALSAWLHDDDPADDDADQETTSAVPRLEVDSQELLKAIASTDDAGPSTVSDLRARMSLSQVQVGIALHRLRDAGVISIEGAPGEEVVHKLDAAADGD